MATLDGSYITVEKANSYWQNHGDPERWATAEQPIKKAALRNATAFLDSLYDWPGVISDSSQALSWPRDNATDKEGRELTGIPQPIFKVTAWLAGYIVDGNELFAVGGEGIEAIKAGTVKIEWAEGGKGNESYSYVESLLSVIVNINSNQIDLVRG